MEVLVSNYQEEELKNVDRDFLERLARYVLTEEKVDQRAELSVVLVSEKGIQALNLKYRKKDVPTDVLSFSMMEDTRPEKLISPQGQGKPRPKGKLVSKLPMMLGEVFIAPEVAKKQAKVLNSSFESEMSLLLVHGILHILDYDHNEVSAEKEMRRREEEILTSFFNRD